MKKENYIIIALLAILMIVILSILVKNYNTCKVNLITSSNPFNTLEILDEKVRLKENERTYNMELDCSKLIDENTQIVYYQLAESHRNATISVETKLFKENEIITTNLNEATNLETIISILDNQKTYEQIYHIKATCLNVEKEENKVEK